MRVGVPRRRPRRVPVACVQRASVVLSNCGPRAQRCRGGFRTGIACKAPPAPPRRASVPRRRALAQRGRRARTARRNNGLTAFSLPGVCVGCAAVAHAGEAAVCGRCAAPRMLLVGCFGNGEHAVGGCGGSPWFPCSQPPRVCPLNSAPHCWAAQGSGSSLPLYTEPVAAPRTR